MSLWRGNPQDLEAVAISVILPAHVVSSGHLNKSSWTQEGSGGAVSIPCQTVTSLFSCNTRDGIDGSE